MNERLTKSLYPLVLYADHKALRGATPSSFDWTTVMRDGSPPLHHLVHGVVACKFRNRSDVLECAKWLMSKGADPSQVAPEECGASCEAWQLDVDGKTKDDSKIEVAIQGHSAISLLIEWKDQILALSHVWGSECCALDDLDALLGVFTAQPLDQRKMVSVDESVLRLWEDIFADDASHDVTIVCQGGETIGSHALILSNASPVMRAMLSSSFREGAERRIDVTDAPLAAARLFLELAYTGGSAEDLAVDNALSALDLAHRWQVSGVINMLDRALVPLICRKDFVRLAEAAILKSLPSLTNGCVQYALKHPAIINSLEQKKELSTSVLALIGRAIAADGQPAAKKPRRSF